MRVTKKFIGVDTSDEITMDAGNIISLSVACSENFSGIIKIKRKMDSSNTANTRYEFTSSDEVVINDVMGAIYYAEIETGDYTAGVATVKMRT